MRCYNCYSSMVIRPLHYLTSLCCVSMLHRRSICSKRHRELLFLHLQWHMYTIVLICRDLIVLMEDRESILNAISATTKLFDRNQITDVRVAM